jgi:type I restriction enzyme R subunit
MLVTSIACTCYELFSKAGMGEKCAAVTRYKPSPADIKGEGLTEKVRQYEIYNPMLGGKDRETFAQEAK